MSAVNSIYHIVINTYRREMTIPDGTSEHMYRYIWSIINSVRNKDRIVNYINRQREHHKEQTFEQEYKEMINRSGLERNDYRLT